MTRERLPKEKMIRFVIGPGDVVVPDLAARLPGRGIWLSARGDVIETARARGAFARACRRKVAVPPDLASGLQTALARRVGEHLGLARRAGQAVAGFAKAREWLTAGRAGLVVQARDGSRDERTRFLAGWIGRVTVVTPLDAERLGAVFGRDHTVHVAIAPGRLADLLLIEAGRLAGFDEPAGSMDDKGAGDVGGGIAGGDDSPREKDSPSGEPLGSKSDGGTTKIQAGR
jgi:predicted RNA-binding protein YlxR (DUF448 family)